jgi:nucleoside-diphosphate-sugar epimerase
VNRPRLIITGASGFIGRHLLERLKQRFEIVGLARRTQVVSGSPIHPNIFWQQVDIADRDSLGRVFREIRRADQENNAGNIVIHLAAHYDFTGYNDPEYERTNILGLRNVLEECRGINLRRFIFSSSLAACRFPVNGFYIDESSEPDGEHIYAHTKRVGEKMLQEFQDDFPSTVVRFAALFSDWCEYPPLFMFLGTWLSRAWNSRILGGRGESAIPYLHVWDAARFLEIVLQKVDVPGPGEVLICSGDGAVSHAQLFDAATEFYKSTKPKPIHIPQWLCGPGIYVQLLINHLLGQESFERPWMMRYIDKQLTIDASRTRTRLDWEPRERLEILRRLPFLIENRKMDPLEWSRRNRAAMKQVRLRPYLKIHKLLEKHESSIQSEFTASLTDERKRHLYPSYQRISATEHRWNVRVVLHQLMSAVRTRDRGIYLSYCKNLAGQRFEQGFSAEEVCEALQELNRICVEYLSRDPEAEDIRSSIRDHVTMTMRFGCDQVQQTFEQLESDANDAM